MRSPRREVGSEEAMNVRISSRLVDISVGTLLNLLQHRVDLQKFQIELYEDDHTVTARGLDPAVLSAIVGGMSGALVALVKGLLDIARTKGVGFVELHTKDGQVLKFPANLPNREVDAHIERLKRIEATEITLTD